MQRFATLLVTLVAVAAMMGPGISVANPLDAVVGVNARVPSAARTAPALGTERRGSGVVIDDGGLVLTIGYLILEADEVELEVGEGEPVPAALVAYDHESGLGLVRAQHPLGREPASLGESADLLPREPLLAVSRVDQLQPLATYLVDRRTFAGYWEYLLEDALFTSPPLPQFGGAALFDEEGDLVGIGSLIVPDADRAPRPQPGNMFIPIDELEPILADLLAEGRRADPPRPWLGVYSEEHRGRVFVTRVAEGGPAEQAAIEEGDLLLAVDGEPVSGLADLYRKIWALGEAGIGVPLDVLKGIEVVRINVPSADRYRWLRLDPTY